MNIERSEALRRRAALHAALGDPARLQIVDALSLGEASPSELGEALRMGTNLVAHHLRVLEDVGLIARHRSEGDRRRSYVHLISGALDVLASPGVRAVPRVLFVCTANSARSHLAAALWRRSSDVNAASAGTHPAERIAPGTVAAARRHHLDLPLTTPRHVDDARADGDLIITVCDRAHEELGFPVDLHWSIPDPLRIGTRDAFDDAVDEISRRVRRLAPVLTRAS